MFCCFSQQTSQKKARRASRAGLLQFHIFLAAFYTKYPEIYGALRAPDGFIPLRFFAFYSQIPNNSSQRVSRAGLLHYHMFQLLADTRYSKENLARLARRITSFPYGLAAF